MATKSWRLKEDITYGANCNSKELASRTARRSIANRTEFGCRYRQAETLGYRKGTKGGVWLARYYTRVSDWKRKLALADDILMPKAREYWTLRKHKKRRGLGF